MKATSNKADLTQLLPGLDDIVRNVHSSDSVGLSRANMLSDALTKLNEKLEDAFIDKMMVLQGTRVGFKTDLDDKEGYPRHVVKRCIIEALLIGLQPHSNQFNIINGGCYTTKEGFKELLDGIPGLEWHIVPGVPRINGDRVSATIPMSCQWTYGDKTACEELQVSVNWNNKMTFDAGIGKAERKARAWLYTKITGREVAAGDVTEAAREKQRPHVMLEDLVTVYEKNKTQLSKAELKDADRIIREKEVDSYEKMFNIINAKA